jgi:hypothetical protein
MTLTETIKVVQAKNEKDLAARIAAPKPELDDETRLHIQRFQSWCKSRGVPAQPAAPTTVAAFIRAENAFGVDPNRIFNAVRSIEHWHDSASLSNPCATLVVRTELGRILKLEDRPRSWPKSCQGIFVSLPEEARAVILRREEQNSTALRKLQNKVHDTLSKKGST